MTMQSMTDVAATPLPLRFQIGARTLVSVHRQLVRVPLSLEDAMAGHPPTLPPLDRGAHGYAITSLPADQREAVRLSGGGMIGFVRQSYTRHFIDLSIGFDAYEASLSANTRSGMRRKRRKLAEASGGTLDVRRYETPDELADFHRVSSQLSKLTYQQRLLGGGLPDDDRFLGDMYAGAAAGTVRAWLLYLADEPAAYLYLTIVNGVVRYDHVGHDPAFADLSPGGVLQMEALRDLFNEGNLRLFDFTEGDGQHKRQFATGGIACIDMLLLRPTLANRLTTTALGGFDRTMAIGKVATNRLGLQKMAKRLRR